ncbi:MAG: hypothetical protein GC168_13530 [Candidatus Hydrogenedens sp.]|nr:hypothetical protein [Candidatus Hydrogenedens sp.]
MKTTFRFFTAAILMAAIALPAFAQDSSSYKIGVVDMQKVMADYEYRKQEYNKLEAKVKELQAPIDALSSKIEALKADYDKLAAKPDKTADDRKDLVAKENEIRSQHADYEAMLRQNQLQIDENEKNVLEDVVTKVQAALKEIGEKENYHLILNGREGSGSAVVYHAAALDITSSVLSKLNGSR